VSEPEDTAAYIPWGLRDKIPQLSTTENDSDPIVWVKLSAPDSRLAWYVIEYDGENTCFGYVVGQSCKFGRFLLSDLACASRSLGFPVTLDPSFIPKPLSEVTRENHRCHRPQDRVLLYASVMRALALARPDVVEKAVEELAEEDDGKRFRNVD
jgi:hypothetical protein